MEFGSLRCFLAVADEFHFGRAAERLGYTTSHVSHVIQRLERELGVPLFERTSRQVLLTPAGAALLPRAQAVLAALGEFSEAAGRAHLATQSELILAVAPGAGGTSSRLVHELTAARPDIHVQVKPLPRTVEVIRAVVAGSAAAGVAHWWSPRLEYLAFPTPPTFLYVTAEHALARRSEVSIDDLDGEPLLIGERGVNPGQYDGIVAFFTARDIQPSYRPRHITSTDQIPELVASRQGVALGAAWSYVDSDVVAVPVVGELPPVNQTFLLWPGDCEDPRVSKLVEIARGIASENEHVPTR